MTKRWGERRRLPRAVQRGARSMVQWGPLREGEDKGVFIPDARRILLHGELAKIIVEAILVSAVEE